MLILLDFDGTVMDSEYTLSVNFAAVMAAHGYEILGDVLFQKFAGMGAEEKIRGVAAYCGKPITDEMVAHLLVVHPQVKHNLYDSPAVKKFSHVDQAFEDVQKAGHELGICSNAESHGKLVSVIARENLTQYFNDAVYTTETVLGYSKPNPAMLSLAALEKGYLPKDIIYVGDTLADIHAAINAGIPRDNIIAFVSPRYGDQLGAQSQKMKQAGAGHVITGYQELAPLVKTIGAHRLPSRVMAAPTSAALTVYPLL